MIHKIYRIYTVYLIHCFRENILNQYQFIKSPTGYNINNIKKTQ